MNVNAERTYMKRSIWILDETEPVDLDDELEPEYDIPALLERARGGTRVRWDAARAIGQTRAGCIRILHHGGSGQQSYAPRDARNAERSLKSNGTSRARVWNLASLADDVFLPQRSVRGRFEYKGRL